MEFGYETRELENVVRLTTKDGSAMYRYLLTSKLIRQGFAPAGLLCASLIDEDGKCVYSGVYPFTKDGADVTYEVQIGGFDGEEKETYFIEMIYDGFDPSHTIYVYQE